MQENFIPPPAGNSRLSQCSKRNCLKALNSARFLGPFFLEQWLRVHSVYDCAKKKNSIGKELDVQITKTCCFVLYWICFDITIAVWNVSNSLDSVFTVKLARSKLPANAGNFTCSSQVKRTLAQFTCVTCSLPVNTSKFTCFEAASTSSRIHANCLRAHVNLPEYHRHFTGSFTCGTHANLLLQAKKPAIPRRITCNCRQSAITPRVNSLANCR